MLRGLLYAVTRWWEGWRDEAGKPRRGAETLATVLVRSLAAAFYYVTVLLP